MHTNTPAYIAAYKTDPTYHTLDTVCKVSTNISDTIQALGLGSTPEEVELANPAGASSANITYSSVGTCVA